MTYDVIDKYISSVLDNLDNDNVLKIIINGYIKIDFVYVSLFSSVRFKNK